ncbi:MAG: hypothetical protein ACRDYA_11430 [Egibacteraceae bacterium]
MLAIVEGVVPPSLDIVRRVSRKVDVGAAVSNSFGFGGHNAVLMFRRA